MADYSGRDVNFVPTLTAVSTVDNKTPVTLQADPTTHALVSSATITTGDIEIGAVEIKDGDLDTRQSVLKGDGTVTNQNAALVAGAGYTTTTLTLNVGSPNTGWYDMLNYAGVSVEILTNSSTATLTFQTSGDSSQTNIVTTPLANSGALSGALVTSTTSATASYFGSRTGRYFRVSSNVSGVNTVTLVITFYTVAPSLPIVFASGISTVSANQTGTWTVQPGNTANTTAWLVSDRPATSGGNSIYRNLDTQSTGVSIKASAGQVYGWYIANNASSVRYVKLYDKATAASVGTDTPVLTIAIPANAATNVFTPVGIPFTNGISIGGVTGVADSNTGAPTANDIITNLLYT